MPVYQAVIETATGSLLRAGFCDFEFDGSFDAATETIIVTDPIQDPIVDEPDGVEVTQWNGTTFATVSRGLSLVKADKLLKIQKEFTKYLEKRYSPAVQRSMTLLLGEANSKEFTVRAAHIQQGIDWVNEALTEYYAKRDAVNAAVDAAGVDAVELDLDTLDLNDPELTLEGARSILS